MSMTSCARGGRARCSRSTSSVSSSSAGSTKGSPARPGRAARQPDLSASASESVVQQLGQPVDAVDPDRPLPRSGGSGRRAPARPARVSTPKRAAMPPLQPDRHVAQPDRPVTRVEQGLRHHPDRVGEVDDPGVRGRRASPTSSAMSSTTGTVRSALAKPPAPVVSWPISAETRRQRLVHEAGGLAADAQLHEDEMRAVQGLVAVAGHGSAAGPAVAGGASAGPGPRRPPGAPVDVEQDQLVDRRGASTAGRCPRRAPGCTCCRRRRPRP